VFSESKKDVRVEVALHQPALHNKKGEVGKDSNTIQYVALFIKKPWYQQKGIQIKETDQHTVIDPGYEKIGGVMVICRVWMRIVAGSIRRPEQKG